MINKERLIMLPVSVQKLIAAQENERVGKEVSEQKAKELMRKQGCHEAYIEKIFTPREDKLSYLGVAEDTVFYQFYAKVVSIPKGQGEPLHSLDDIIGEKESQFHESEHPGIYDRFLQISSIEGEGSYFYEIDTEIVYDADWGEEEAMMSGTLEKKWPSFYAFLEWYYSERE